MEYSIAGREEEGSLRARGKEEDERLNLDACLLSEDLIGLPVQPA